MSDILGIGNSFSFNHLFTSLKSDMNLTVIFFLGIVNLGEPHSLSGLVTNTLSYTNLSTSRFKVSINICGTGNGLPWYGSIPYLSSNFTGEVF